MLSAIDTENLSTSKPHNQVMVSLDAVALYPSLEAEETSRVCAMMVSKSKMWIEAVDWEEAALYLVLTGDTGDVPPDCLPQRKYSSGAAPSITTAEVLGPIVRRKNESKFFSPVRDPTQEEKIEIIRLLVKTGIVTVMTNHTYRWNRSLKLQTRGGGIGDKLAQAAARLFMLWWDGEFMLLLKHAGMNVSLYKRYVDDGNCKAVALPPGVFWDSQSRTLVQKIPPDSDDRPADQRTAEAIREIANSVSDMLSWTCDFPSNHSSQKMPVLDIQIWVEEAEDGTVTNYEFYSKPMANPVSIPANSAVSNNIKFASYRQEVIRVLKNTALHLPWSIKLKHLSFLSHRMQLAGYSEGFRSQILADGIKGYLKKVQYSVKNKTPLNRPRSTIMAEKINRKNWPNTRTEESERFSSVLFVPATERSVLAKQIRKVEFENKQGRQSRIKIVERTGRTVLSHLSSNYPWAPQSCNEDECFQCSTNNEIKISCRKPGVSYRILCTKCPLNGVDAAYEGETGKCLFVRGKWHMKEFKDGVATNGMVIHNKKYHQGSKEMHFRMEALQPFRKPLDRQIDEALRIKNSEFDILMNSGTEWRIDSVPRARFTAPGLERRRQKLAQV